VDVQPLLILYVYVVDAILVYSTVYHQERSVGGGHDPQPKPTR
jgi:hypothetical protein